jgi:hypothetical protein
LKSIEKQVSYGWGMIPVRVVIGQTEWTTSLWPKDGQYIVPIKDRVRSKEKLEEGSVATIRLSIEPRGGVPAGGA